MSSVGERLQFTAYDVISSFLPGGVFIVGLLFPFTGVAELLVNLRTGSILIFLTLSFAAGLAFQSVGGYVISTSDVFSTHMAAITSEGETIESPLSIDVPDVKFVGLCRDEFDLESEFDDWDGLYRLVISRLDRSRYNRATRLQALQLGVRGLGVAMFGLATYYLVLFLYAGWSVYDLPLAVSGVVLALFCVPCVGLGTVFIVRSRTFAEYSVRYIVSEFLEVTDESDPSG